MNNAVDTSSIRTGGSLAPERLDKRPLYMQIADQLKEYMIEQGLGPGDNLPTEKELVEIFQVSRSTVREALRFLQALGVVDIRQRQGAVLSEAKISNLMSQLAYGLHFVQNPEGACGNRGPRWKPGRCRSSPLGPSRRTSTSLTASSARWTKAFHRPPSTASSTWRFTGSSS